MTISLPPLHSLRAFEVAARHLSFTKAAEELNLTQTAVSHAIKRLEDDLGVKLFVRHRRRLKLTPEAALYLPAVRSAFDDLMQATSRIRRSLGPKRLTVTTLTSFAMKWLVPRLASFQEHHPDIEVLVSTNAAVQDLRREGIDVGIRYGTGSWPGLRADFMMNEDVFPVCSPALLERDPPLRTPRDLQRHTLLRLEGFREEWNVWMTAAGISGLKPAHWLSFDLLAATVQAAIDGVGVALGRSVMVESDLKAGRLVAPFKLTIPAEIGYYLVTPEERADDAMISAFRAWVLGQVARK